MAIALSRNAGQMCKVSLKLAQKPGLMMIYHLLV